MKKNETTTPDKGKLLLRSYIMSLLSLMLCVTMLLGTTFAWFTSQVSTPSNEIYVGSLEVDLVQVRDGQTVSLSDPNTHLFGHGHFKWEPGATQIETVTVVNKGDLSFTYGLYFSNLSEAENLEKISPYLDVYVTTNSDLVAATKNAQQMKDTWIRVGTLAEVMKNGVKLAGGSYNAVKHEFDGNTTVTIALHMPAAVTEKEVTMKQTATGLTLKLIATQTVGESDDFNSPNYDQNAPMDLEVGTYEEFAAAMEAGYSFGLTDHIEIPTDKTFVVDSGKKIVIDTNGYTISSTSAQTGSNREMFNVQGSLTIQGGGKVTYKHVGENMGWGSMTAILDITAGGVVHLYDVTLTNEGGSDMNFVAHLNNWGTAALYMDGATLEAGYCAVRVFNSGNDMNNVVAKNTTLTSGNMALWVHNYTEIDFGASYDKEKIDARLNIQIWDESNTLQGKVRYGFTNAEVTIPVDTAEELSNALAVGGTVVLRQDITLTDESAALVVPADNTVVLDLNGKTISQKKAQTAAYALIENNGTLTIRDSVGTGLISYQDTAGGGNYASNTITNKGVLNVEGGTIENLSATCADGYPHALDVYQGSVTNITGGTIKSEDYDAIRMFCNSNTLATTVNISGGTIYNRVTFQNPNNNTHVTGYGVLNITGGTFVTTSNVTSNVRLLQFAKDASNMKATISGGIFDKGIGVSNYTNEEVVDTWMSVTGGTFGEDPSAYLAAGYTATESNGAWIVAK